MEVDQVETGPAVAIKATSTKRAYNSSSPIRFEGVRRLELGDKSMKFNTPRTITVTYQVKNFWWMAEINEGIVQCTPSSGVSIHVEVE